MGLESGGHFEYGAEVKSRPRQNCQLVPFYLGFAGLLKEADLRHWLALAELSCSVPFAGLAILYSRVVFSCHVSWSVKRR